jgi:iron-sulfur cluster repair protein YtfE (RIC family)
MDAITFLKSEHVKVKKALISISKKSRKFETKKKMFDKLSVNLAHHEKMEEKVWYPFLKKNTNLASIIKYLVIEEKEAGKALAKMKKMKVEDVWEKHFTKIKKAILQHAKDEETKLFPKARKDVERADLVLIGKKMRKFKKALDKK